MFQYETNESRTQFSEGCKQLGFKERVETRLWNLNNVQRIHVFKVLSIVQRVHICINNLAHCFHEYRVNAYTLTKYLSVDLAKSTTVWLHRRNSSTPNDSAEFKQGFNTTALSTLNFSCQTSISGACISGEPLVVERSFIHLLKCCENLITNRESLTSLEVEPS